MSHFLKTYYFVCLFLLGSVQVFSVNEQLLPIQQPEFTNEQPSVSQEQYPQNSQSATQNTPKTSKSAEQPNNTSQGAEKQEEGKTEAGQTTINQVEGTPASETRQETTRPKEERVTPPPASGEEVKRISPLKPESRPVRRQARPPRATRPEIVRPGGERRPAGAGQPRGVRRPPQR